MVWFTSKDNGNAFEVFDPEHAAHFEAAGHEVHQNDPRVASVKIAPAVKSK